MLKNLGNLIGSFALLGLLANGTALAKDPYFAANKSWIVLSGDVKSVSRDRFELNYGDGTVTVEMDDGDRDADGYKLIKGDQVTVSGMVDRDLFETTTIEASSVHVENINTTFYASSVDDEDKYLHYSFAPVVAVPVGTTFLYGQVSEIGDKEFVLNLGDEKVTVDVDELSFNPLDGKGYIKLEKGDKVGVRGAMTDEFFDGRDFEATQFVSFSDKTEKGKSKMKKVSE